MSGWAMLAENFDDVEFDYPVFVQPKLNGVRAKWDVDRKLLISRQGKVIPERVLPSLYEMLKSYSKPYSLDGELFSNEMSFQELCGAVNGKRLMPHKQESTISLWAFDIISDKPAPRKIEWRHALFGSIVKTEKELAAMLQDTMRATCYDGIMIRIPCVPYQVGRTKALIKLKPWKYAVVTVVDFVEGEGKFKNKLGSFFVQFDNKFLNVGGGSISEFQREKIWQHKDVKRIQIRYRDLSKSGIPLQPQIESWSHL